MFVTFFLGILDLVTGEIKYTNAGHNPPVIIRKNGEIELFEVSKSIPVGLFETVTYPESSISFLQGDKLVLYTDGVTEAENCEKKLYSTERLVEILRMHTEASPRELIRYVEEDVTAHAGSNPQSDDITMMTLVYNG